MVISGPWHVDGQAATGDRPARPRPGPEATGIVDTAHRCGRQDQVFLRGDTCVRLDCLSGDTRDLSGERKTPRQAVPNSGRVYITCAG